MNIIDGGLGHAPRKRQIDKWVGRERKKSREKIDFSCHSSRGAFNLRHGTEFIFSSEIVETWRWRNGRSYPPLLPSPASLPSSLRMLLENCALELIHFNRMGRGGNVLARDRKGMIHPTTLTGFENEGERCEASFSSAGQGCDGRNRRGVVHPHLRSVICFLGIWLSGGIYLMAIPFRRTSVYSTTSRGVLLLLTPRASLQKINFWRCSERSPLQYNLVLRYCSPSPQAPDKQKTKQINVEKLTLRYPKP